MNLIILKIKFWHLLIFEFIWWGIGLCVCSNVFEYDLDVAIPIGAISSMVITIIVMVILIIIDDYRLKCYNKSQQS